MKRFSLKTRKGHILTALVLIVIVVFSAYAATREQLDRDSDGYAGVGIDRLNIVEQANGKWTMEATFYHRGFVEDTRTRGADNRFINFIGGAAFFRDNEPHAAVDRANIIRKRDNLKPENLRDIANLAHRPKIYVGYDDIGPGDSELWLGRTHLRVTDIDTPSKWWVGGVTYAAYDDTEGGFKNQVRAVSRYDIDGFHEQLQRTNYFREDIWNHTHIRLGSIADWP